MPAENFWGDVDGDGDADIMDDWLGDSILELAAHRLSVRRKILSGEPLTEGEIEFWRRYGDADYDLDRLWRRWL